MIQQLSRFFNRHLDLSLGVDQQPSSDPLRLAAAALLLEVARADFSVNSDEQESIQRMVASAYGLTPKETDELIELAEEEVNDATCLHSFTSLINEQWPLEKKIELVERMWQVAYADNHLDSHEQHLIRKIATLLYLPHKAYVEAKLRGKATSG